MGLRPTSAKAFQLHPGPSHSVQGLETRIHSDWEPRGNILFVVH
jgi:hypothetical protein